MPHSCGVPEVYLGTVRRWWARGASGCRWRAFPGKGPRWPLGVPFHSGLACLGPGLREEAARPVPGLPVQARTAGLFSILHGQGQTQDEVVPSLLSGWLLAALSGAPVSVCPSGEERKGTYTQT